jgi:hypothetical protein
MAGPVRTAGPGPARIVAGAGATVDAVNIAGAGAALAATGADGSDKQPAGLVGREKEPAARNGRAVSVLFP